MVSKKVTPHWKLTNPWSLRALIMLHPPHPHPSTVSWIHSRNFFEKDTVLACLHTANQPGGQLSSLAQLSAPNVLCLTLIAWQQKQCFFFFVRWGFDQSSIPDWVSGFSSEFLSVVKQPSWEEGMIKSGTISH